MTSRKGRDARLGVALWATAGLMGATAYANVYPSGLSVDASSASATCGTVGLTYYLNEDADGDGTSPGVRIEILDSNSAVVRTVTAARQNKGKQVFHWDGRDDAGNPVPDGSYRIRVTTADFGHTAWTLTSDDNNRYVQFEQPRGLAVNKNPDSPYYGRIYVVNTRTNPTASGRPMGDGFYMLNADQSSAHAPGQEDTALTGGENWSTDTDGLTSPWKIEVGLDDRLYITDFWDSHGTLFSGDPELATIVPVFEGIGDTANPTVHGNMLSSPVIEGTLAGGDLRIYGVDEDLPAPGVTGGANDFWLWNIGAGPLPHNTPPESRHINDADQKTSDCCTDTWLFISGVIADATRGPDGKFYLTQYRFDGAQTGLLVLEEQPDGEGGTQVRAIWDSLTVSRALAGSSSAVDLLRLARAVAVSPDGSKLVVYKANSQAYIMDLVNGIPQLSSAHVLQTFASTTVGTGRDAAWDAAGNLYVCSNLAERVRVFSPPTGAHSNSTTSGTFSLNKAASGGPTITAQPQDASACPNSPAQFNVSATGSGVSYQWRRDGEDLPGETGATLSIGSATAVDDGAVFTVEVCDANGVVVSDPAVLTVGTSFIQTPASSSGCASTGTASFSFRARGVGSLNYQWKKDGNDIPGESGVAGSGELVSLNLTGLTAADNNTQISVTVTDDCGPITSPDATLTLSSGPTIQGLCCNRTVNAGTGTTFLVTATGTGPLSYQWKKTLNNVTTDVGSNTAFLVLSDLSPCDSGALIFVVVTDACGTTTSDTVTLTVNVGATETSCDNGCDEDGDGLLDCQDPDCGDDVACQCPNPQLTVDIDADQDVDGEDFAVFQRCFTGEGEVLSTATERCDCFDVNNDGQGDTRITLEDYAVFMNCVNASGPEVPAPTDCDGAP